MRSVLFVLATGCVAPGSSIEPPAAATEVAIARVAAGDTLSGIADRLSFPGGWRALARFNDLHGDLIRAGAGLRVPVDYLRAAGIDPYGQMDLERFAPPLARRPLAPCHVTDEAHGECVYVAGVTACIALGEARDERLGETLDEPDGAIDLTDRPDRMLVIDRAGTRTELHLPNDPYDAPTLAAFAVDLDGDRRDEIVIAAPISIRNHHGFRFARIFVVGEAGVAQLDVAHFGTGSLIEGEPGRCDLLATSWEDVSHPLDGPGMYFVGRPLRYDAGELVPRGDEVARRFRTYFHASDDDAERPAEWLSEPAAAWWPELGLELVARDHHDATITGTHVVDGALVVEVALASGERWTLDPRVTLEDGHHLERIGWAPTSTLFPEEYVPADPRRWIGARAIVTDDTFDPAPEDPLVDHVLWVTSR